MSPGGSAAAKPTGVREPRWRRRGDRDRGATRGSRSRQRAGDVSPQVLSPLESGAATCASLPSLGVGWSLRRRVCTVNSWLMCSEAGAEAPGLSSPLIPAPRRHWSRSWGCPGFSGSPPQTWSCSDRRAGSSCLVLVAPCQGEAAGGASSSFWGVPLLLRGRRGLFVFPRVIFWPLSARFRLRRDPGSENSARSQDLKLQRSS